MSTAASPIPARADYGAGCYRRAIRLEAESGIVRGELADDFHHFAVTLRHDGERVTAIEGEPVRVPWTTCPGALAPLRRMQGILLDLSLREVTRHTPARAQCTHWHDLACLAIAHAGRFERADAPLRRYDFAMPDRVERTTRCTLLRDGEPVTAWRVTGMQIAEADDPALEGLRIGTRPFREALALSTGDAFEARWVLQRAFFIGLGRQHDFEAMQTATEFATHVGGACHTYSDAHMHEAQRHAGTVRDFSDAPEAVLRR